MNKQFIIFALLLTLVTSQTYSITICSCAQLLSEGDCLKNQQLQCSWDSKKKVCAVSTTPETSITTYAAYCDTFAEADCLKAKPCTDCGSYAACAWINKTCKFFTGCTAFTKTTDPECQAISNRCITDGTHCVEIDVCSTYKKQLPCVKNPAGSLCYWDTANNTCVDADTCDKLPTTFETDQDCRDVISTCTTKTGGGCVNSGNNCSDQTLEIQCVWNKLRSIACYWDGAACKNRICENAPAELTTDKTCKTFRNDGTCTTKANGGCVTRTTCAAATLEAACIKNSTNGDCYWTGTECVNKTCTNAPTTIKTNTACGEFLTGCITKKGGGCIANGACSSANFSAACVKNISGVACIWDTICKEMTCANAPTTNNTHELCTSYLPTCTVKTGGGCQPRTCANAPTILTTNDACETYLPGNNCITKTGGGCVRNTTCSNITLEAACVKNSSGATCFYDTVSSSCKDKICINAPLTNTTHDLCVAFLSTCTVNSTKTTCVNKTCENSLTQDICDKDYKNNACIWKEKCYKRECVLASSTTATHADCQTYDSNCTLSNTGIGCVPIPLKCEAITIKSACNIRLQVTNGVKSYSECGWNGSQCIDKACSTAPRTTSTTNDCNSYKSDCVANNPVNGFISGCQDLPKPCAARKSTENCEITRVGLPTCIWNSATSVCVQKSCSTASITNTTGFLASFGSSNCSAYLSTCIVNNTADSCIPKQSSCSSLSSINCGLGSKVNGDCYWNGSNCVDRTCKNIQLNTHSGCQGILNTCTVNNEKTTCQFLATACSSYRTAENCKIISNGKSCTWTGSTCRNATCLDASDNNSFDSDIECSKYPTSSETCTVLYKTGGLGCVTRSAICSDYKSEAQCYRTLTANSDDCTWKSTYSKCFSNTYLQGACSTFQGTQAQCQQIKLGCTNSGSAVETDTCTFSCTVITGLSDATHSNCQGYNTTCTVNAAGTACVTLSETCSGYIALYDCVRRIDGARCFWDGSACVNFAATHCPTITGLTSATHQTCQAYHTGCTVNVLGDGCQEMKVACSGYYHPYCTITTDGTRCFWDASAPGGNACGNFTAIHCYYITGLTNATHQTCQAYHTGCTVNVLGDGCQEMKVACSDYAISTCTITTDGTRCFWDNTLGTDCVNFTAIHCYHITGLSSATHATCQAYHTGCTVNVAGTACQEQQAACSSYVETTCTLITGGSRCYWNGSACSAFSTCEAITGSNLTWDICQGYNSTCSIRRDGNGCATLQSTCSGYITITSCYRSTAGYCTANSSDTACQSISDSTTCEAIKLGASFRFDDSKCNTFKTGCKAQSTSGCRTRTCAEIPSPFTHENCNAEMSTCTANLASSPTACTTMAAACASLSQAACVWAVEGECAVQETSCVKKTCDTPAADSNFDNHTKCFTYLSTCTVARVGGCQARAACSTYKSSQQCKFNSSNQKCFWNPTNKTCVHLNCDNIEATFLYNTDAKCALADSTCTVRAISGSGSTPASAVPGCMARGACSSYLIEDQCKTNASGGVCVWNKNSTQAVCQDKSCTTAPYTTVTHNDCDAYFSTSTIKCTVFAKLDPNSGVIVREGCQQRAACSTYIHQEQCKFNPNGDACGWNGTYCADKSCGTAPASTFYDDNDKCRAYFNDECTVASSGQGCVEIPDTCEIMVKKQCVTDKSGRSCYWNGTGCITRSCENAPEETATAEECNTYLKGCTLDSVKCKIKICEDFTFTTDAQCKQQLSTCTTNGTNCVTRGNCYQSQNQAGCVTSATNQLCEWMPAVDNNQAYCTIKTCNTAPVTLTSEAACAGYFTNCTTKNGGGCVTKSICQAVTIDAACTTALNGTICAWDSAQNICRDKDCQDFSGTTHAACQAKRVGCTVGANGKCARVQNCEQTTIRSACIEGTNGPCLWINDFNNNDGSKGACFRYTSCKSLSWNSDAQCKLISNQCTTNGSNCIGITLCSETNTDGGCVTGYDGDCIQSVPALNSSDPKVCKSYTSCADAFYITHSDCQIASSKCTTNGTTGCIALGACSSYTSQAGCYLNDKGIIYTSGAITSTGRCTWDRTTSSCRDQLCSDLTGTTYATCSSQLSTCTSDGTTCLLKGTCSSYTTEAACTTAVGSDGTCFWELESVTNNKTAKCRLLTCADIKNDTEINVCSLALSSCVSNGTACIPKAKCSTYTTKTACNSGGLDGICVFTQSTATGAIVDTGICALMTACIIANNDQIACQAAKDRCAWIPALNIGATLITSKCANHTCATNQVTNGDCTRFLNWDKKTQQICTLVSGICTAADPSTLSSNDCFLVSGYTYTWNAATGKCEICTNFQGQINNTKNQTKTDSGYMLGLSTVILGYLMF